MLQIDPKFNVLEAHKVVAHVENELVKCEVCGKICKNRALLFHHNRIHDKVECAICHKMISKEGAMAAHLRMHSAAKLKRDRKMFAYSRSQENLPTSNRITPRWQSTRFLNI